MNYNFLRILKYLTIGFLILMFQNLYSQEPLEEKTSQLKKESKHSIHAEIVGRTLFFSSINYEYKLTKKITVGSGLGLMLFSRGGIDRNIDGVTETGTYFDLSSTQMIYGNYFIGKNKHKLFFTGGLTNFMATYRNKYPSGKETSRVAWLRWNAGIGYHLSGRKTYFRFTAYAINMPDDGFFPLVMPWLGISYGFMF